MSDGGRGRASRGMEVWTSYQKWSAQPSAVRSIAWLGLGCDKLNMFGCNADFVTGLHLKNKNTRVWNSRFIDERRWPPRILMRNENFTDSAPDKLTCNSVFITREKRIDFCYASALRPIDANLA